MHNSMASHHGYSGLNIEHIINLAELRGNFFGSGFISSESKDDDRSLALLENHVLNVDHVHLHHG
jgi:hypothetical protein